MLKISRQFPDVNSICLSVKLISYHLVSQSIAALCSCRWPAPCPALARVAIMTMSSGKPVPSPWASMSVAMGMSVLRRTVHTPSPTWLLSRTIWVVSTCRSCRFSCTISSCSESFGGAAVMRVSQACRREGSTQASWAREPHRHNRLGFGLFSAGKDSTIMRFRFIETSNASAGCRFHDFRFLTQQFKCVLDTTPISFCHQHKPFEYFSWLELVDDSRLTELEKLGEEL